RAKDVAPHVRLPVRSVLSQTPDSRDHLVHEVGRVALKARVQGVLMVPLEVRQVAKEQLTGDLTPRSLCRFPQPADPRRLALRYGLGMPDMAHDLVAPVILDPLDFVVRT